jgi:hypothetical protein
MSLQVHALHGHAVGLVQDLNRIHFIQKCLNRLSAQDAQFIYDALVAHCVVVRLIATDAASCSDGLIMLLESNVLTLLHNSLQTLFSLVQSPFRKYVVQYIYLIIEPHFTNPLYQSFWGNIRSLSKQKFSSNVI